MHQLHAIAIGLLLALPGACSNAGGYDEAKYCGAVGPTVNGAVDDDGRPLNEFDQKDRERSYRRLARLGPSELREDWERIGTMVGGDDIADALAAVESQRRVTEQVKRVCGFQIETF